MKFREIAGTMAAKAKASKKPAGRKAKKAAPAAKTAKAKKSPTGQKGPGRPGFKGVSGKFYAVYKILSQGKKHPKYAAMRRMYSRIRVEMNDGRGVRSGLKIGVKNRKSGKVLWKATVSAKNAGKPFKRMDKKSSSGAAKSKGAITRRKMNAMAGGKMAAARPSKGRKRAAV